MWGSVLGLSLAAGIIEGPRHGWGSPLILGCFAAALLALIGVVVTELHRREPLIDAPVLRVRAVFRGDAGPGP